MEVRANLEKIFEKMARDYQSRNRSGFPELKKFYESGDGRVANPRCWHSAGIGKNADEASAAARFDRVLFDHSEPFVALRSFYDSDVHDPLVKRVAEIESYRELVAVASSG